MLTPSSIASSTTHTGSISPATACDALVPTKHPRIDQPATECQKLSASEAPDPGRHHVGILGDIIPESPGGFVGIRRLCLISLQAAAVQAGDSRLQARGSRLDTREAQVALMVLHAALPNSSANTSTCTARPLPRMALASVEISVGGLATYIRMIGI